ncbi:MAG: hypothetical protein IH926_11400 [Proteobacteria bacterium]|nr:hypothetical protein [Pseudomonadota bacterium]
MTETASKVGAEEIRVLSAGAVKRGVGALAEAFGRDTGAIVTVTFATAPADASTTSIDMTSDTGTDASGPVAYLFTFAVCASNGGTGGTSSAWQTGTTYTDTGLQVNQCYKYTVTARDSIPNTGGVSVQDSCSRTSTG